MDVGAQSKDFPLDIKDAEALVGRRNCGDAPLGGRTETGFRERWRAGIP